MGDNLLDNQQVFETLYDDYFKGEKWWIFITPFSVNDIISVMEDKYFKGDKNKYFHMIMYMPYGAIYMARKDCITKSQINDILVECNQPTANINGDILMMMKDESDKVFGDEVLSGLLDIEQIRSGK